MHAHPAGAARADQTHGKSRRGTEPGVAWHGIRVAEGPSGPLGPDMRCAVPRNHWSRPRVRSAMTTEVAITTTTRNTIAPIHLGSLGGLRRVSGAALVAAGDGSATIVMG